MFYNFISEIRDQLAAIRLVIARPTKTGVPKVKVHPKTAYGWFRRNWGDADFRAMLVERIPSLDDAFDDPVEDYKVLNKDEKALVRELVEAQCNDGASDA